MSDSAPAGKSAAALPDARPHSRVSDLAGRVLAARGGVILGRAAEVVLGGDRGFDVRLDGPAERRAAQGVPIEGIGEEQARRRRRAADRARDAYLHDLNQASEHSPC